MAYKDSDYNWTAFQRRIKETFLKREVFLCSVEDLIIGKLQWYDISRSEKQLSDLMYLLQSPELAWIKEQHPSFSELEVTLEFVPMSYEAGEIEDWHWEQVQRIMAPKIRRDWAWRFQAMMKAQGLTYKDVAKLAGFKNGNVVKATVNRGVPHFARLMVVVWEKDFSRSPSVSLAP